jgi:hypothetical protein
MCINFKLSGKIIVNERGHTLIKEFVNSTQFREAEISLQLPN